MPKVTGLALGRDEIRVVEVEGSSRRFRLVQAFAVPLLPPEPPNGEEPALSLDQGRRLAAALKEHRVQRDHVAAVLSGRDCLVRNFQVALKGTEAIRKIIRFEAEGQFQSIDIDQVVADFLPVRTLEDGTEVLVVAAPKGPLGAMLQELRRAGVDPERVELDAVALHRAVLALGALETEGHQVILDVGRFSVRVLLVAAGRLAGMRTLRFGWGSAEEEGRPEGERLEALIARLGREVARFLAGSGATPGVARGLLTGSGAALPGLRERLASGLGLALERFDPLERLEHSLEPEEAERVGPTLLPALGAALELLGAVEAGMNFRQGEFAFTRKFERVRFPLAVSLMFLAFLMVVQYTRLKQERGHIESYYGTLAQQRGQGWEGYLVPMVWKTCVAPLRLPDTVIRGMRAPLSNPFDRIPILKTQLEAHKKAEEKRLGYFPDLPPLDSGLHVLRSFGTYLERALPRLSGKVLVTSLELRLEEKGNSRFLAFDLLFWGDGRRADFDALRGMWDEACRDPQSPFAAFDPSSKEDPTNPLGGSWRKGNKLMLKPEGAIPIVEPWPPAGL